jgi:hypothetical protein
MMSILVGFSITAMGVALMFNVQNAQDKQLTAQAQVGVQNLAWAGSETIRQVLMAMPLEVINVLPLNDELTALDTSNVAGLQGRLTPTIISRVDVPAANGVAKHTAITVDLASVNETAQVGTTLQMVYGIFNSAAPLLPSLNPITFYHDAGLEGRVNFRNIAPGGETLTVKGSVTFTSQVTGVNTVRATGDVTINNPGVVLKDVYANGTVTVSGDGKILDKLVGLAGVNLIQGFAGSVYSNGNINYTTAAPLSGGSNIVSAVAARGAVTINNQNNLIFNEVNSLLTTSLSGCSAGTCFKRVEATGRLTLYPPTLERGYSRAGITCSPPPPGPVPANLQPSIEAVAPSFTGCANSVANSKFRTSTPSVKVILQLPPVEMTPLNIDVWDHQANANYFIRYDGSRSLVTVKNVKRGSTALNGEFELVRSGALGYLCPLNASGVQIIGCLTNPSKNVFCTDNCWTVQGGGSTAGAAPNTFLLEGHVAPGVIFFDGNLSLKMTKLSPASFLAAGFIKTEGNTGKSLALNFAGPSGGTEAGTALGGVCSNLANAQLNLIPTNFCQTPYNSTAAGNLGNVALMAGGKRRTVVTTSATYQSSDRASETTTGNITTRITPNAGTGITLTEVITYQAYKGGDIQLAADNVIFGSIMAGNMLKTEGTSTIYGYIVSSALARSTSGGGGTVYNDGGLGLTQNRLTAATNIDHSINPQYYEGKTLPGVSSGPPAASGPNDVRVLRSRYL